MTKSKNLMWIKLSMAILISSGLIIASLALRVTASGPDDFSRPYNLSNAATEGRDTGVPRLVSKGNVLSVVWSEGYNTDGNTKSNGSIFLNSADETSGYWRQKITVFTATLTAWGNDPAIIFDNSSQKVHIVWAEADASNTSNLHYRAIKYARCDVSTNFNTCTNPQTIASAGVNSDFRNPVIAQDDANNLHVVWTDEPQAKVYYSRGFDTTQPDGASWQTASEIGFDSNGKTPQIAFQDGRLHLVWTNKSLNQIEYMYDNNYSDNSFIANGINVWSSSVAPFSGGQVGHPSIVADAGLVFVAFDIQDPTPPNTDFYLVHARSTTNGTGWTTYKGVPDARTTASDIFKSDNANISGGLRPSLVITHTAGITHLNIAWHTLVGDSENASFDVFHTWVDVNPADTFEPVWATPAVTVTNPSGTSSGDAVAAAIAASESDKLHAVYLDRENSGSPWDAYYRGFIAGTIDPEYITTDMAIQKTVTPSLIFTTANTIDATTLKYAIAITNLGELDAIGLHITDTMPSDIASVSLIEKNMGNTTAFNPATKIFTWQGDIPAHQTARITITALTANNVSVGQTLTNQADVWSDGAPGSIATSATANTYLFRPSSAFRLDKIVNPRHIVTTATTIPAQDVDYTIRLTNLTDVPVPNLKITDPLSDTWWWYISSAPYADSGTADVETYDYDTVVWTGNLAAHQSVNIYFTAKINNGTPAGTFTNTTYLITTESNNVLLDDSAVTIVGPMIIYLPLVMK